MFLTWARLEWKPRKWFFPNNVTNAIIFIHYFVEFRSITYQRKIKEKWLREIPLISYHWFLSQKCLYWMSCKKKTLSKRKKRYYCANLFLCLLIKTWQYKKIYCIKQNFWNVFPYGQILNENFQLAFIWFYDNLPVPPTAFFSFYIKLNTFESNDKVTFIFFRKACQEFIYINLLYSLLFLSTKAEWKSLNFICCLYGFYICVSIRICLKINWNPLTNLKPLFKACRSYIFLYLYVSYFWYIH